VGLQGARSRDYLHQLADDGRARLREWIAANVPSGSTILAEDYTGLSNNAFSGDHRPGQEFDIPPGVLIARTGAGPEAGDLQWMRRRGINYIAIADTRYNRYFAPVTRTDGDEEALQRYRQWYIDLDSSPEQFELVWANIPRYPTHSFTNPTLKLYRVKQ
jgi:hypothetical protein